MILSRQNIKDIPVVSSSYEEATEAKKRGCLVKPTTAADITLFANGSEVSTLIELLLF